MNNSPIISVIMSAFNAEKYIAEAIQSILGQSFADFEFIIVDDGSTDNTRSVIEAYAKRDARICTIFNHQNKGLIFSLNSALSIARGKYIARMDADDVSMTSRFALQVRYMETHPEIFLVGGSFEYIDVYGKHLYDHVRNYSPEVIRHKLPHKSMIHHPTVMFRNEENIFYREKALYCEDRDLWLRFLTEGKKLTVISDLVLKYRLDKTSVCGSKPTIQRAIMKEVVRWYFERQCGARESYDTFDLRQIISRPEYADTSESINYYQDRSMLEIAFKCGTDFVQYRTLMRIFMKKYGFFSWPKGVVSYPVSFLPLGVIELLVRRFF